MRPRFIPKLLTLDWKAEDLRKLLWGIHESLRDFDDDSANATEDGMKPLADLYIARIQLPKISATRRPSPLELRMSVKEIVLASFVYSDSKGLKRIVDGVRSDPEYVTFLLVPFISIVTDVAQKWRWSLTESGVALALRTVMRLWLDKILIPAVTDMTTLKGLQLSLWTCSCSPCSEVRTFLAAPAEDGHERSITLRCIGEAKAKHVDEQLEQYAGQAAKSAAVLYD